MADLDTSINELRRALGSIPRSEVSPGDWSNVEAYNQALDDYEQQTRAQLRSPDAPDRLEYLVAEATAAASAQAWEAVIQHAFSAIGALPGRPSWKPRRPLPPPR